MTKKKKTDKPLPFPRTTRQVLRPLAELYPISSAERLALGAIYEWMMEQDLLEQDQQTHSA